MTEQEVWAEQTFVADSVYALPEEQWLRTRFATALRTFYQAVEHTLWTAEQSDCDDFARLAGAFASARHNRSAAGEVRETGLAFGEYWYQRRTGTGHAINCAVVSDGGERLRLLFFEPQNVLRNTDPIIELTPEEKAVCYGYRF